jgi:hypothetical protein
VGHARGTQVIAVKQPDGAPARHGTWDSIRGENPAPVHFSTRRKHTLKMRRPTPVATDCEDGQTRH